MNEELLEAPHQEVSRTTNLGDEGLEELNKKLRKHGL